MSRAGEGEGEGDFVAGKFEFDGECGLGAVMEMIDESMVEGLVESEGLWCR